MKNDLWHVRPKKVWKNLHLAAKLSIFDQSNGDFIFHQKNQEINKWKSDITQRNGKPCLEQCADKDAEPVEF